MHPKIQPARCFIVINPKYKRPVNAAKSSKTLKLN